MKTILSLSVLLCPCPLFAAELPALPSQQHNASPHKVFFTTESDQHQFDSWKIDSGYSYNLFDKVDLYVGARLNNGNQINETGFLSGVSYQLTPRVSVQSTLHSYKDETINDKSESSLAAEVTSRMKLTDNIDMHATLDYQEWQKGVEFGLGFRF